MSHIRNILHIPQLFFFATTLPSDKGSHYLCQNNHNNGWRGRIGSRSPHIPTENAWKNTRYSVKYIQNISNENAAVFNKQNQSLLSHNTTRKRDLAPKRASLSKWLPLGPSNISDVMLKIYKRDTKPQYPQIRWEKTWHRPSSFARGRGSFAV